ncbi:hypothetical protein CYMTET_7083 [Cymbomonas tetramitiformis]|uniref:Uncharacterized protein n=1 Tax=Cymbomonas tetramitiformis TaxID=36881 RepID=A0AAE0GWA4_9CHLO|nr:hypothetical protein CYMTET_7083 [Cymbomonas tetramitiformis]
MCGMQLQHRQCGLEGFEKHLVPRNLVRIHSANSIAQSHRRVIITPYHPAHFPTCDRCQATIALCYNRVNYELLCVKCDNDAHSGVTPCPERCALPATRYLVVSFGGIYISTSGTLKSLSSGRIEASPHLLSNSLVEQLEHLELETECADEHEVQQQELSEAIAAQVATAHATLAGELLCVKQFEMPVEKLLQRRRQRKCGPRVMRASHDSVLWIS